MIPLQRCHFCMYKSLSTPFNCTETSFKNCSKKSLSSTRSSSSPGKTQDGTSLTNTEKEDLGEVFWQINKYHKKHRRFQGHSKSIWGQESTRAQKNNNIHHKDREYLKSSDTQSFGFRHINFYPANNNIQIRCGKNVSKLGVNITAPNISSHSGYSVKTAGVKCREYSSNTATNDQELSQNTFRRKFEEDRNNALTKIVSLSEKKSSDIYNEKRLNSEKSHTLRKSNSDIQISNSKTYDCDWNKDFQCKKTYSDLEIYPSKKLSKWVNKTSGDIPFNFSSDFKKLTRKPSKISLKVDFFELKRKKAMNQFKTRIFELNDQKHSIKYNNHKRCAEGFIEDKAVDVCPVKEYVAENINKSSLTKTKLGVGDILKTREQMFSRRCLSTHCPISTNVFIRKFKENPNNEERIASRTVATNTPSKGLKTHRSTCEKYNIKRYNNQVNKGKLNDNYRLLKLLKQFQQIVDYSKKILVHKNNKKIDNLRDTVKCGFDYFVLHPNELTKVGNRMMLIDANFSISSILNNPMGNRTGPPAKKVQYSDNVNILQSQYIKKSIKDLALNTEDNKNFSLNDISGNFEVIVKPNSISNDQKIKSSLKNKIKRDASIKSYSESSTNKLEKYIVAHLPLQIKNMLFLDKKITKDSNKYSDDKITSKKSSAFAITTANIAASKDLSKVPIRRYHVLTKLQDKKLTEKSNYKNLDMRQSKGDLTTLDNLRKIQWRINNFYKWHKLNNITNVQLTLKRSFSSTLETPLSSKSSKRKIFNISQHKYIDNSLTTCNIAIGKENTENFSKILFQSRSKDSFLGKETFLDQQPAINPEIKTSNLLISPTATKCTKEDYDQENPEPQVKGDRKDFTTELFLRELKQDDEISSSSKDDKEQVPKENIWNTITNYIKSGPDVPPPAEFIKHVYRHAKHAKPAKLAGLVVCETDQLSKDNSQSKVITTTATPKNQKGTLNKKTFFSRNQAKHNKRCYSTLASKSIYGTNIVTYCPRNSLNRLAIQNVYFSTSMKNNFPTKDEQESALPKILDESKTVSSNESLQSDDEKHTSAEPGKPPKQEVEYIRSNDWIQNRYYSTENMKLKIVEDAVKQRIAERILNSIIETSTQNHQRDSNKQNRYVSSSNKNLIAKNDGCSQREISEDINISEKLLNSQAEPIISQYSTKEQKLEEKLTICREKSVSYITYSVGSIPANRSVVFVSKRYYSKGNTDVPLKDINQTLEDRDRQRMNEKIIKAIVEATSNFQQGVGNDSKKKHRNGNGGKKEEIVSSRSIPKRMTLSEIIFTEPRDKYFQARCLAAFLDIFRKTEILSDTNYEDIEKMKTKKLVDELNKLLFEEKQQK